MVNQVIIRLVELVNAIEAHRMTSIRSNTNTKVYLLHYCYCIARKRIVGE
jgi:hypothetical protein